MFDLNYHNDLNRLLKRMTSELNITYASSKSEIQRIKKEEIITYRERLNKSDLSNKMMEDDTRYSMYFHSIILYFNLEDKFEKYCNIKSFHKLTTNV